MTDQDFNNPHKEEYNNEPVFYCGVCLSLKIKEYDNEEVHKIMKDSNCYGAMCTSTDISSALIVDWEKMFQNKYGYKYINIKK